MTREQFLNQVLEVVGRRFPLVKIARADQSFSMRVNGHVASLENIYRMTILNPDQMQRNVERWIVELLRASEGSPDIEGSFEELRERILPLVLPEVAEAKRVSFTQPLVPGLMIAYGIDNDRTISHLTPQRIKGWGIDPEQLHEVALENLIQRSQNISAHAAQDESGTVDLILFQTMDGYDSSRLLLPDLHEKLREHLASPFAAAVPNRDILLCFRNDEETIGRLRPQIQSDFAQMPHQISREIYLITADGIALHD